MSIGTLGLSKSTASNLNSRVQSAEVKCTKQAEILNMHTKLNIKKQL